MASSAVSPAIASSLRRCSSSAVASRLSFSVMTRSRSLDAALAVLRVRLPAIELVEPAGELLLLLEDAPLDLLNLLLAGAALLVELGANPQRVLLGLELGRADPPRLRDLASPRGSWPRSRASA